MCTVGLRLDKRAIGRYCAWQCLKTTAEKSRLTGQGNRSGYALLWHGWDQWATLTRPWVFSFLLTLL